MSVIEREGAVGVATSYGLDGRGSVLSKSKIIFSSPQRPDKLWDHPSALLNEYFDLSHQE
jgi:hypothetical protein